MVYVVFVCLVLFCFPYKKLILIDTIQAIPRHFVLHICILNLNLNFFPSYILQQVELRNGLWPWLYMTGDGVLDKTFTNNNITCCYKNFCSLGRCPLFVSMKLTIVSYFLKVLKSKS